MRFLKTNSIRILCISLIFSLSNLGEAFGAGLGGVGNVALIKDLSSIGVSQGMEPENKKDLAQACKQLGTFLSGASVAEVNAIIESELHKEIVGVEGKAANALISTIKAHSENFCQGEGFCSKAAQKLKEQKAKHELQQRCLGNIETSLSEPTQDLTLEAMNNQATDIAESASKPIGALSYQFSPVKNNNSSGLFGGPKLTPQIGGKFFNSNGQLVEQVTSSLPQSKSTCVDKKNCFFNSSENMESGDCNLLTCSLATNEAIAVDEGFNKLFNHMVLKSSDEFKFKGDKGFCGNCLKKVYEQTASEGEEVPFEQAKAKIKSKVKNEIASRLVAKDLLDWMGHLEFLKNREYIDGASPVEFKRRSCVRDIAPLISMDQNPCGKKLGKSDYHGRLLKAFEVAKLPKFFSIDQFLTQVDPLIDMQHEGQSCRKAHALERYLSFHDVKNEEHQLAVNYIFKAVQSHKLFNGVLDSSTCKDAKYPEKSFVNMVADTLADEYANNIIEKSNLGNETLINSDRCLGGDLSSTMFCGEIEKTSAPPKVAKLFGTLTKKVDESVLKELEKARVQFGNHGNRGEHVIIAATVKTKAKREFSRLVRDLLNRPMKMDPNFRVALGNWKNVCDLHSKSKSENKDPLILINTLDGDAKKNELDQLSQGTCSSLRERLKSSLCSSVDLSLKESNDNPELSIIDIKVAQKRALKKLTEKEQVAANSLKCELNGDFQFSGLYPVENSITLGKVDTHSPISDLESVVAYDDPETPEKYKKLSPYKAFIDSRLSDGKNNKLACASDDLVRKFNLFKGNPAKETKESELLAQERAAGNSSYNRNLKDQLVETETEAVVSALTLSEGGIVENREKSFGGGGRSVGNQGGLGKEYDRNPAGTLSSSSVSQTVSSNSIEESSSSESIRSLSSSSTTSDLSESQTNGNFQNLFGYLNNSPDSINPSYGTQNSANYQVSNSGLGQSAAKSASSNINCDANCVDQLKGLNSSSVDINQAADALGVKGIQSSSDDLKQMFSDVLDGKLDNQALDELREENKKLREEMLSIKQELETKAKPVKVLDSNGIDRSSSFTAPESNSNIVFNPRNSEANEFRSRNYYENKKDAFAPSYSDNSAPERVSLGEYSAQRRAASTGMSPERVKKYSGDIDRTFLQANPSRTVDDAFVKKYVEHVDKSSGSIEHLLVYENGRPARIRVPDPDSPGEYIEQPIAESLVEDILEKVEKDEMNSYAVYNMVNFGQSLEQFMSSLETEKSNLTSLSALNSKLDELRNMAQ